MLFKKEILRNQRGLKSSTGEKLSFKKEDFKILADNFNKRPNAYIPYSHTSNPLMNTGWVKEISYDEETNSVYAVMDIIDEGAVERIKNGLVKDVSVSIYKDEEGFKLNHVALVLDPALKDQKPFKLYEAEGEPKDIINLTNENPFEEVIMDNKIEQVEEVTPEVIEVAPVEAEAPKVEPVELEENIFKRVINYFSKDEHTKNIELERDNYKTELDTIKIELESKNAKVIELEASVDEAKQAVIILTKEMINKEMNSVFDSYIGKKVVPAEKELLFERISNAEELRVELEARPDMVNLDGKGQSPLENPNEEDKLAELTDEEKQIVQKYGWDKPEKSGLLDNFKKLRK